MIIGALVCTCLYSKTPCIKECTCVDRNQGHWKQIKTSRIYHFNVIWEVGNFQNDQKHTHFKMKSNLSITKLIQTCDISWYFKKSSCDMCLCICMHVSIYFFCALPWKSWDLKSKANREQPANHEQDRQSYIEDLKRYIETGSKPSATVTKTIDLAPDVISVPFGVLDSSKKNISQRIILIQLLQRDHLIPQMEVT